MSGESLGRWLLIVGNLAVMYAIVVILPGILKRGQSGEPDHAPGRSRVALTVLVAAGLLMTVGAVLIL